jgi:hypothetical protein
LLSLSHLAAQHKLIQIVPMLQPHSTIIFVFF